MGKSSNKTTEMTAKEKYELVHFNKLPDIIPSENRDVSLLGKRVWVRMEYGILRGMIDSIDLITDRYIIKLENGEDVVFHAHKEIRKNWIKERS